MTARRVLIAGCGYLGQTLASRLSAQGDLVWGLRRQTGSLPSAVHPVDADLRVPNTLRRLPDVDHVVYMASADEARDESYRAAYVDGPSYLLQALRALGHRPKRLYFVSSVRVFGADDGRFVDEDSAAEPQDAQGRRMLEGERLVRDGPYPATIVRLGEIYGPGRPGLLDTVLAGRSPPAETMQRWLNLLHRDDCAAALAHLIGRKKPEPLYVAVDRQPVSPQEVLDWLASQLEVRPPPADGTARASQFQTNVRCLSERLVDSGFRFLYPSYREGYRALLRKVR
jgi:nucleoside-diphosphate-sugar epimerase